MTVTATPLIARDVNTARSSVIVSVSFLAGNVFGGLLALMMVVIVGEGPDVDGFLAAYSAYLIFTLFGANLRVALVPVLGGTEDEAAFRERARTAVRRLAAAGAVMCAALALLAPLIGPALVPGAPGEAKTAAATATAILAGAAWCQIWSAGLAAVLAASQRFATSAMLYAATGLGTVVLAVLLMPVLGTAGAALGIAGSALGLLVAHTLYLRRFEFTATPWWRAVGQRATWRLVGVAAAGGAAPLAFQVCLSIALAGASGATGAVTAYSYGYLLAVLLSGVTTATLGFTTLPALVQAVRSDNREAVDGYLATLASFSLFLYLAPAAGYAAFGRPLLDALLDGPLSPATVALLWDVSRIFLAMGLLWALLAPVTPLALAQQRFTVLAVLAAITIPVEALFVLLVRGQGVEAVAIAHAACVGALPLLVLVWLFGRRTLHALWRMLRAGAPALALALIYPALALGLGLDDSMIGALLGLTVGTALYVGLAVALWPAVGGQAVRLLRGAR
jgi:peptidoglycan biosynthesis protein MviN/MurJ (putative lipid II flippase)